MEAIELYQEAYYLHKKEGRLDDAMVRYNQIISQFPTSEEAKYARIQLQSIRQAQGSAPAYPAYSPSGNYAAFSLDNEPTVSAKRSGLAAAGFVFSLLAIVGLAVLVFWQYSAMIESDRLQNQQAMQLKIMEAEISIGQGDFERAEKILNKVKVQYLQAYFVLGDLYLKQEKYDEAVVQYEMLLSNQNYQEEARTRSDFAKKKRDERQAALEEEKRKQEEDKRKEEERKLRAKKRQMEEERENEPEPEPAASEDVNYF